MPSVTKLSGVSCKLRLTPQSLRRLRIFRNPWAENFMKPISAKHAASPSARQSEQPKIGGQNERHIRRNTATSISAIRASTAGCAASADRRSCKPDAGRPAAPDRRSGPAEAGRSGEQQAVALKPPRGAPDAFERAKEEQDEAAKQIPKRAKPGMGHNQPPEAMTKEAEKAEKTEPAVREAATLPRGRQVCPRPGKGAAGIADGPATGPAACRAAASDQAAGRQCSVPGRAQTLERADPAGMARHARERARCRLQHGARVSGRLRKIQSRPRHDGGASPLSRSGGQAGHLAAQGVRQLLRDGTETTRRPGRRAGCHRAERGAQPRSDGAAWRAAYVPRRCATRRQP